VLLSTLEAVSSAAAADWGAGSDDDAVTVTIHNFDAAWQSPIYEMYQQQEFTDVVMLADAGPVFAHRVVLAAVSPHLRRLFGGRQDDATRIWDGQILLEGVASCAVEAITEFAYTGKIVISGATVVCLIEAANLLQVAAVERVAMEFLVSRLDPWNVLTAVELGRHLAHRSALGNELRAKSLAYIDAHFSAVAGAPPFFALPPSDVLSLVARDELEVAEEEVFSAVLGWVKVDHVRRAPALAQLLPAVRYPLLTSPMTTMMSEPLVGQHPLFLQLLSETHQEFQKSSAAADCPRLRPRVQPVARLGWMEISDAFGGFKRLAHFPSLALAVSKTGRLELGKAYDAPPGYHWASKAEVVGLLGAQKLPQAHGRHGRILSPDRVYYCNQGGWSGYNFKGVHRGFFLFCDSLSAGGYISSAHSEGVWTTIASPHDLRDDLPKGGFAGIVCIASPSAAH
jgi:hypothetical protein